jgi:hypothetical protein
VADILSLYPDLNPGDPRVVALNYLLKQLDCILWALNKGYNPDIESIDVRARDVAVYMTIFRMINEEIRNKADLEFSDPEWADGHWEADENGFTWVKHGALG